MIVCAVLLGCAGTEKAGSEFSGKIIAGAERRLGGAAAIDAVSTLRAEAAVEGPGSRFTTTIWSARDGRARMEQSGGLVTVLHPSGDWHRDVDSGLVTSLDADHKALVRGHELHATVLYPESRYRNPRFAGRADFSGQRALVVEFRDSFDDPVCFYFSASDTLPLGLRITHQDPDVTVTFGDWEAREGLFLFTSAAFEQGGEVYRYSYVAIDFNSVPDSMFASPAAR
jgi:hypothetical protein